LRIAAGRLRVARLRQDVGRPAGPRRECGVAFNDTVASPSDPAAGRGVLSSVERYAARQDDIAPVDLERRRPVTASTSSREETVRRAKAAGVRAGGPYSYRFCVA
jgi:hypothetical protein